MTLRRPPYWESASSRPLVRLSRSTIATVISERRGTLIVRFSAIRKVASVSSKIANFITADCHGKSLSLRRCATCCPMKRSAVERVAFISITHHTPWRSLLGEVCRVGPTLNSFDNLSKPVARRLSYSQSVSQCGFVLCRQFALRKIQSPTTAASEGGDARRQEFSHESKYFTFLSLLQTATTFVSIP